jgi:carbon starvation protein CstA
MKSFISRKPVVFLTVLIGLGALTTAVFASPVRQALASAPTDWAAVALILSFALMLGVIVVHVWRETVRQPMPLNSLGSTPWSPKRGIDRLQQSAANKE